MHLDPITTKDFNRVREMCGPALSRIHEALRVNALTNFEVADTDEKRLRLQVEAVTHRDLAAQWRDDEATIRETVLNTDLAQNTEGTP